MPCGRCWLAVVLRVHSIHFRSGTLALSGRGVLGDQFFHPLSQFEWTEWLRHELGDTTGKRLVGDVVVAGEHESRCLAEFTDAADGFKAVEVRQSEVDNKNFRSVLADCLDTGGGRGGFVDL